MTKRDPTTTYEVTLPWPPRELSPNARVGWRVKAAAVQSYRYECKVETLNQYYRVYGTTREWKKLTSPVDAVITFVLKDKRRHDWDNLLASIKAGIDGIVDAGVLRDDDVRSWSPALRFEQGDKAAVRITMSERATGADRPGVAVVCEGLA